MTLTVGKVLAIIALGLGLASFVIDGPLLVVAVIVLAIAVIVEQ